MPIKLTTTTYNRLEKIIDLGGYKIRQEKGTFNSGQCILEQKKLIVINRFLDLEGKIRAIIDMLPSLKLNLASIEKKDLDFLSTLQQELTSQNLFSHLTDSTTSNE